MLVGRQHSLSTIQRAWRLSSLPALVATSAGRCCINPPITPEGEDTPKWAEKMAAEEEAARVEETSIGRQPEFPQTPDKTVFTHNVESGNTPAGATNYESFRVENKRTTGSRDCPSKILSTSSRRRATRSK